MLQTRIIPALLLRNQSLVKTVRFRDFSYIGDPCNTVRIFNELEVDELLFLDIAASLEKKKPNFKLLAEIANECFMPLSYGGGLRTIDDAKDIFEIGFEKLAINSFAIENPLFITELADKFGSQSVIASIDVKKDITGNYKVFTCSGRKSSGRNPVEWAQELENLGAGEILLTSIDREGTWSGFDLELVSLITKAVSIPVIAHGGAGCLEHIKKVVKQGGASAVALGSMVVYQKKGSGVLINFPEVRDFIAELI